MASTPILERNARRVIALSATARHGADVRRELEPVIEGLRSEIDDTVPKAVAARLLSVSVPTLNKWIARGLIPTRPSGRYQRVPRDPLLELAGRVEELRRAGKQDGLLAEVAHRLQTAEPEYQQQAEALYGASLDALRRGNLVPADIPATFGPDD